MMNNNLRREGQKQMERGFTMIEMMITMMIALVIMAGMMGLFVSQTRTAQVLNSKSEVLNDLFLASQMMQFELRGAKAICWDSVNTLIRYQPLSSPAADNIGTGCTAVNQTVNGYFQRKNKSSTGSHPSAFIFWNKPGNVNSNELIRGMKADAAVTIAPINNATLYEQRTITLTAQYLDKEHNARDLSLTFKVWPRNKQ